MLHNVTSTSFDHVCSLASCQAASQARPHSDVERVETPGGIVLVVECAAGHRECFNMALDASHETDERYSDEHRHQARQIRMLQKHLNLVIK